VKSPDARAAARKILTIVPRVMRSLASELRAVGELPAPAHFGVLSMLAAQRRGVTLTRLAALHGVSLPTMSNTVTAMEDRGWVRRTPRQQDRRIVQVEVTASGRAVLRRVRRVAEVHLAAFLAPLGPSARQQLEAGLDVLTRVFARATARPSRPARPGPSARPRQTTRPAAL
jgi:DNA-binding MarR family transcriptional regulator